MKHWMALALASAIALACASKTVSEAETAPTTTTAQADVGAGSLGGGEAVAEARPSQLPSTASPMELWGLLSLGALGAGLGLGALRRRTS
jgi:hypothetical protein